MLAVLLFVLLFAVLLPCAEALHASDHQAGETCHLCLYTGTQAKWVPPTVSVQGLSPAADALRPVPVPSAISRTPPPHAARGPPAFS